MKAATGELNLTLITILALVQFWHFFGFCGQQSKKK